MVADDDPPIVEAIKMMLELEGYDVATTLNGSTLREMKDALPDLL